MGAAGGAVNSWDPIRSSPSYGFEDCAALIDIPQKKQMKCFCLLMGCRALVSLIDAVSTFVTCSLCEWVCVYTRVCVSELTC